MPTLGVKRDELFRQLGRDYTEEEFDELCFEFGVELDEVTSERQQVIKEQGKEKAAGLSDEVIYKIDLPANRHDLLCVEGLVHSLKVFLNQCSAPRFSWKEPVDGRRHQLVVTEATQKIRPVCVGAVLRNITFTQHVYDSFIDLQDKLHQNIGRRRSLVSIGTHDLDTVTSPFTYDAKLPHDIKFVALNEKEVKSAPQLMEMYRDTHLKPYLPIIEGRDCYPVISDAKGVVLSMPPIINGDHSKISLHTTNVFVEVTGTDETKVNIALDTIVSLFSYHCSDQFRIEPVDVVKPDGSVTTTPLLPYRTERVKADYLNKKIGINISAGEIADILTRMCLESEVVDDVKGEISVTIPPTRSDILHACDIVEDVAIAYGYDNILNIKSVPRSMTIGSQQLAMKVSERLRCEMACCGFTEALTFALCSIDDCGSKMRLTQQDIDMCAVKISNPKTLEFQMVRTCLVAGLLKTLSSNRNMPLPLKLFEVQEIVVKDATSDTGAVNQRHLAAVVCNTNSSNFELMHGLVDRVMQVLEYKWIDDEKKMKNKKKENKGGKFYFVRASSHPSYFQGRCAEIVISDDSSVAVVGKFGVVHPQVISNFDLQRPCSAMEINLEHFYQVNRH